MTWLTFELFREILAGLCPFFDCAIIAVEKSCQQDILRTPWARILIFYIQVRINIQTAWLTFEWFLYVRLTVMPFVGCKTREPHELGTWNFICNISTKNKQKLFLFSVGPCMAKLCPFLDSAIITIEKTCQHDNLRSAWARILIFGVWLGINV